MHAAIRRREVQPTAVYANGLRNLLADAEMAALIAAAPQLGRSLRPLCRMLGVALVPGLIAPSRARPRAKSRPHCSPELRARARRVPAGLPPDSA